jgi:soluble lytic murein transglycosylase-like protein
MPGVCDCVYHAEGLKVPLSPANTLQLERGSVARKKPSITGALRPSGLEPVMQIESAFDLSAFSRAGAMGLMQLMPQLASDWA